jgi:hypothetical protein
MPVAEQVLSRFPRHLDVDAEGKIVGDLTRSLAEALEAQTSQVGKIRRSHRVGEAEQVIDLVRLGNIDGFTETFLGPLGRRTRLLAAPATEVDALLGQLGFEHDPGSVLVRWPGEADDTAARARFADAVRVAVRYDGFLDRGREALVDAAALVLESSGTVAGLLGATAAYLGLELVGAVSRDETGYWHLAHARDRFAVELPGAPGDGPGPSTESGAHLLALEENPPHLADNGPIPRHHADLFTVNRLGFDAVPVTVIVVGTDDRTMHPMVVNVDDGEGVASIVDVPDGSKLRFERDGRVELDGASVARRCFRFHGAVFAAGGHPNDFVFGDEADDAAFGDRAGRFAVTSPISDGFDPNPGLPHGDGLLTTLQLARRGSRFAVFVGAGVFGREQEGETDIAAPEPLAGFFDETVFQPDPDGDPSFEIGFEWDERETYAVRVWLPAAFAGLDRDGEASVRELVRILLDRHRAAGVHVYVEFTDPRWILGTGVVRDLDSEDALGIAVAGTEAWTDATTQPTGPLGAGGEDEGA